MSNRYISITAALVIAAGVAVCSPEEVFAQDAQSTEPVQQTQMPEPGVGMPPPDGAYGGYQQGGMPPPPFPGEGGYPEHGRMPPPDGFRQMPPPRDGEFYGGTEGRMMPPPEMSGRPGTGSFDEQYKQEHQRQYQEEVKRRTEMRTREMQQGRPQGGQDRGYPTGGMPPQGGFGGGERGGFGQEDDFDDDRDGGRDMSDGYGEDDDFEEREKMMQQEQLKQMKRGMVSGMERGLKQIQRMIAKLQKKGITVPADTQALVTELTNALQTIKNATELTEDVEAAIEIIQDKGQDLGDVGQTLGMLERMSQMNKQVAKEFTKLDKILAKLKKSKTASQHPEPLARAERELGALKAEWETVQSSIASGESDGDDLRDTMDEFFEKVGDVHRSLAFVQQLSSVSKMVRSAEKEVAMAEKEIARQKRAGRDVTRLNELLAEGKAKLGEVKALTSQGNFDPEDLFSLMQEMRRIGDEAHDELERVSGKTESKNMESAVLRSLQQRRLGF